MLSLMTPRQTLFRTVSGGERLGFTHGCDRLQVMTEDLTNMLAYDGRKGAGVGGGGSVHAMCLLLLSLLFNG